MRTPRCVDWRPKGERLHACTVTNFKSEIRASGGGVFVVDPSELTERVFERVVLALMKCGSHVIVIGSLTPVVRSRILAAQRVLCVDVLLGDATPNSAMFKMLLAGYEGTLCAHVQCIVCEQVASAPPMLAEAVIRAFGWGSAPDSVANLANNVGVPARTLHRWCGESQLHSPWTLLAVARAARPLPFPDDTSSPNVITARAGYQSSFAMDDQFRRLLGTTRRGMAILVRETQLARLTELLMMQ